MIVNKGRLPFVPTGQPDGSDQLLNKLFKELFLQVHYKMVHSINQFTAASSIK